MPTLLEEYRQIVARLQAVLPELDRSIGDPLRALPDVVSVSWRPDIAAPRGQIIIGRSHTLADTEKRKLARRNINLRGRIEILTYDEVLSNARAYVAGIQRHLAG